MSFESTVDRIRYTLFMLSFFAFALLFVALLMYSFNYTRSSNHHGEVGVPE